MSFTSEKLSGKIALVTGGGIGLATAKRFAAEGGHVFITSRRRESLDEAVKVIGETNFTAVQGDVSKLGDLERLFATIEAEKGLGHCFCKRRRGDAQSTRANHRETIRRHLDTFNTNVKGVVFTVQNALPLLSEGSSIILNASTKLRRHRSRAARRSVSIARAKRR